MKLIDISKKIDKSDTNKDWIDIYTLGREFDLEVYDCNAQDRLQSYWIGNWCCTDTCVGYKMYFLDDEPVGISMQKARKSDEEYEWFSKELALKVRNFVLSLMIEKDEELTFSLCDINDDIGDGFKIDYNANIIHPDKATLNNEPVKILERIRETPDHDIDQRLKIQLKDGEILEVNIHDLEFKFNLIS